MPNWLLCLGSAFFGAALASLSYSPAQPSEDLRVKSLAFVDPEGVPRFTMKLDRELGPVDRLVVADASGRARVRLEVRDDGAEFSLLDDTGKLRNLTNVGDKGANVSTTMFDSDGIGYLNMGIAGDGDARGGFVMVHGKSGAYLESLPQRLSGK